MEIVQKLIADLVPCEYNPRQITPEALAQLKESLQKYDCVEPAVINMHKGRENRIVGGHQRIAAATDLGWVEFPCVLVKLNEAQEKELNVRLNKNTGSFDLEKLADFFEPADLIEWGFDEKDLWLVDETNLPEMKDADKEPFQQITFTLHDEQAKEVKAALASCKEGKWGEEIDVFGNENENGNLLYRLICVHVS